LSGVGKNHGRDDSPDVVTISPERRTTSYRLDPLIARSFKESCRKVGQSTCSVLVAFMYGFSRAVNTGDAKPAPQITVNLYMERRVERIHRKGREIEYTENRDVQGSPQSCAWCGRPSVARVIFRRAYGVYVEPFLCEYCLAYVDKRGLLRTEIPLYPKD